MHIALLCPVWPPAIVANGIVTYVSAMRDHLLKRGHDVSVLSDNALHRSDGSVIHLDQPELSGRVWRKTAERIDRRLGNHPFTGRRIADQLRRASKIAPIDLIEMEESFGWSESVARGTRVPVVTRLHGPQFMKPQADRFVDPRHARHRERAEGRAIRRATNLSAPNSVMLKATSEKYRLLENQGVVIPNPVAVMAESDRWRMEDCERDLILFVGRLDTLKGADMLIAAFSRILAERPAARLEMVGPDGGMEQADGTIMPFVDHARQTLDPAVFARINFTGLLGSDAIRALRRRANVTVVASVCESFSYAAVEAMAAGCPLVSTDWLGAGNVIPDGVAGWLTPVGNAERMADRVNWVLSHPDTAAEVGVKAWQLCNERYGIECVGDQTIRFYQDIIARHVA